MFRICNASLWLIASVLLTGPVPHCRAQPPTRHQALAPLASHTWGLAETDCALHERDLNISTQPDPALEQPATKIDLRCNSGSSVIVALPVEPAWLIPELRLQLDVKPNRPGVRMLVRVVLPSATDPVYGGPLTVWLEGPAATSADRWNRICSDDGNKDLGSLLKHQIWLLRSRHGPSVTEQGAYVDAVGVNLFTGPGNSTVLLSRPEITGSIAANPETPARPPRTRLVNDLNVRTAGFAAEARSLIPKTQDSPAKRNGTVIEIAGQPFFPRIIQHNGEPFGMLRELGFNTVQLSASPTDQQLIAANDAGVWLVCPPPASLGIVPLDQRHDRIIAWSLGNHRRITDVPLGQQLRDQIRQYDVRTNRPVIAEIGNGFPAWGRLIDAALIGTSPFNTGLGPERYGTWINQARLSVGDRIPVWADVPSEYPVELVRQVMAISGQVPPLPMDHQTMELMSFQAIANGARGIRVLSRSRLDANDPQARLRAMTLRWLNYRLDAVEPWAAAGIILGSANGDTGTNVSALKNSRGQLLIAERTSTEPFAVPGNAPIQTIRLPDRWSSVSDQAWQVTDEGLIPLAGRYNINATEIQLDQAPWMSLIVVTQDPALVDRINQSYRQSGLREMVDLRRELTSQWLTILQLITGQMENQGRIAPDVQGAIGEAMSYLRQAESTAVESAPALASLPLDQADQRLAMARQRLFRIAREPFSTHTSSPLLQHPSTLPQHWDLTRQLASQNQTWDPNGLAGGDFENLQHMLNAGWENSRPADNQLVTEVALTASERYDGDFCMRLSANHATHKTGLAEAPPVQITSAPVFVRANKLVRIHGWVRIPQPITGSVHGLVIYDSLGGRDLAVCCQQGNDWQEFTLYRSAGEDTELRVRIVLDGYGEVFVDELTVQTIDLPAPQISSTGQATNR